MKLQSRKSPLVNDEAKYGGARIVDDVQGDLHPPLWIWRYFGSYKKRRSLPIALLSARAFL